MLMELQPLPLIHFHYSVEGIQRKLNFIDHTKISEKRIIMEKMKLDYMIRESLPIENQDLQKHYVDRLTKLLPPISH